MYDDILIPTDGSPEMATALKHGIHQAKQNNSTIHALYVIDLRSYIMLPEETQKRVMQLLKKEGQNAINQLEQKTKETDIEITTEIKQGVPHEKILEYTDENDIDLIVMGTHGRTGEKKRIVGSIAEEVVRKSEIPVLTTRMEKQKTQDEKQKQEEIPEEQQRYIG